MNLLDAFLPQGYFRLYMDDNKLIIFHIYRKNGTSMFLYPFSKKNNLVELLEKKEITGLYGKEPRVESLTLLRNDFYRMIEKAVKDWSAERKFIPRFLISAGFFLLLYFIASVVIRDPVPMVDEILIGLAGSAIMYAFLTRRASDSKSATELKIRLRSKVDEIVFEEDPFVKDAEEYLGHCEDISDMEQLLVNMTSDENSVMFDSSDNNKTRQFSECIRLLYDEKDIKRHERMFSRLANNKNTDEGQKKILRWMNSKKVDPFLFAVYTRVSSMEKK